ncbi:snakin-2-like [Populus alba x Populus x berolinensis]|nr:snakin-2-like [Populus alba x Populus x berolinensis]
MAVRSLLALMVLLFCLAEVSSDLKMDTETPRVFQLMLFVSAFVVFFLQLVVRGGNRRLLQDIDCGGLCTQRCSLHSRPNLCNRACGTCCVRCKCVPPGTSGNREVCGTCYTDMTTHGNKTKCP